MDSRIGCLATCILHADGAPSHALTAEVADRNVAFLINNPIYRVQRNLPTFKVKNLQCSCTVRRIASILKDKTQRPCGANHVRDKMPSAISSGLTGALESAG